MEAMVSCVSAKSIGMNIISGTKNREVPYYGETSTSSSSRRLILFFSSKILFSGVEKSLYDLNANTMAIMSLPIHPQSQQGMNGTRTISRKTTLPCRIDFEELVLLLMHEGPFSHCNIGHATDGIRSSVGNVGNGPLLSGSHGMTGR